MKTPKDTYAQLFRQLTDAVNAFILEVGKHRLADQATAEWTVKDELCHIAYWHEYYAQNYASQAAGTKPFIFVSQGGSTRNQKGVDLLRRKSRRYLIAMVNSAQSSLNVSIVKKRIPKMTYIVGNDYETDKFLEMITGHIERHTIQVRRAKKSHPEFIP